MNLEKRFECYICKKKYVKSLDADECVIKHKNKDDLFFMNYRAEREQSRLKKVAAVKNQKRLGEYL